MKDAQDSQAWYCFLELQSGKKARDGWVNARYCILMTTGTRSKEKFTMWWVQIRSGDEKSEAGPFKGSLSEEWPFLERTWPVWGNDGKWRDWGAHGRWGRWGTGEESGEVGSREDWESGGKPGCREHTGQARKPPPTGLGEADNEADTALCREAHLEIGIGRFRRKQG